jgi:hypothetical protein
MKPKYRRERRIREAEELAVPQDQNHGWKCTMFNV